jgi:hypothetical protein
MKQSPYFNFWILVFLFVFIKILIHLLTNTNYELHRDAFLYLAQGEHLAWGYLSVPPMNAFLSKILRFITGDSTFAVRLFPTLIGGVSVIFINLTVREMGGRKWAMILASLAFIFSPAFLRSNMLFQPVSLNQLFWLISFYMIIRLVNTQDQRYWIYLSINFALGFLTKYSIVFLAIGFFFGLILTPHRKLLWSWYLLYGMILGLIIISPNIIWQHQNSWPIIYHMEMLRQYHLVNVELSDFLIAQLIMNLPVLFFWLTGLIGLLFLSDFRKYRIIGLIYVAVILLLIMTQGKSYYTIGLYSVLLAAGGVVFEKYVQRKLLVYLNLMYMILISAAMLPFSLPVFGHQKMLAFCQKSIDRGLEMPMRWEDGQVNALPQDYADMIGWKELGENVIQIYESLPFESRSNCYIYGENYGQAGAIRYYGLKKGLPEPICFHGSFIFWAPDDIDDIEYLLYVNDEIEQLREYFEEIKKFDGITNSFARESGLAVYLCIGPGDDFKALYKQRLKEELSRFKK